MGLCHEVAEFIMIWHSTSRNLFPLHRKHLCMYWMGCYKYTACNLFVLRSLFVPELLLILPKLGTEIVLAASSRDGISPTLMC